jgi:hypothetical protein
MGEGRSVGPSDCDQAYAAGLNLAQPRIRKPTAPKPSSISIQEAGSGTTVMLASASTTATRILERDDCALDDQAAVEIALRDVRWPTKPSPAKPSSIITQVEGSGTDWVPTERSGAICTNIPSTLVPSE